MLSYITGSLSESAMRCARQQWDLVAKPLHSLGKLEELIVQIAGIQATEQVRLLPRCALVFCADHGVVRQGVSQSGQEVTALVARSMVEGTANISLMAQAAQTDVFAVDMGMARQVPGTINRRIAPGTRDMTRFPAMTREEARQAVQSGIDLVASMKERGYQLVLTGEMGIGNTTSSAAIACALLGLTPEEAVGRGAGLSDDGLAKKRRAVSQALALHQPAPAQPLDVLAKVGGFEIAAMTGVFLGGMTHRVPVVIDGVISAVSALLAVRLCPQAHDFMLPSHMSREPAALRIMEELALSPVIHADMALGEGTGAVALMPLLDMAHRVYAGTHTFEELGMEPYQAQGGQA